MPVFSFTRSIRTLGILAITLLAAACADSASQHVSSGFDVGRVAPGTSVSTWRIDDVTVTVPESLTVSTDPGSRVPSNDIVWWGDPGTSPGERRRQVGAIMREAVALGLARLGGTEGVTADVEVRRFHALTPRARASCSIVGCLGNINIDLAITIRDTATGAVLVESGLIEADPDAVQGDAAREADRQGQSDKVRIISHVSEVVANWLASLR